MKYLPSALYLTLPLLLTGCAAAALEGVAAVDLAAEGAVAESSAGAEAMAVRGGAGITDAGAAGARVGSRLLISDPLLRVAANRGVLQEALYRLTAGGTETATLSVDNAGVIRAGARPIAMFRGNDIIAENRVVGVLDDGWVYEMREGGRGPSVARLHAFVPGRLAQLTDSGASTAFPSLIEDRIFVDVLRIENGLYLVRLANGSTIWIAPELAMLALLASDPGSADCNSDEGTLVRRSGRTIAFRQCREENGTFRLQTANGIAVVDGEDVDRIVPGRLALDADRAAINLTGGYAFYGVAKRVGEVVRIQTAMGNLVVADAARLERN